MPTLTLRTSRRRPSRLTSSTRTRPSPRRTRLAWSTTCRRPLLILCEHANMEKNGKMSQGLMVASNQKLDKMVQALYEADFTKKELYVEN